MLAPYSRKCVTMRNFALIRKRIKTPLGASLARAIFWRCRTSMSFAAWLYSTCKNSYACRHGSRIPPPPSNHQHRYHRGFVLGDDAVMLQRRFGRLVNTSSYDRMCIDKGILDLLIHADRKLSATHASDVVCHESKVGQSRTLASAGLDRARRVTGGLQLYKQTPLSQESQDNMAATYEWQVADASVRAFVDVTQDARVSVHDPVSFFMIPIRFMSSEAHRFGHAVEALSTLATYPPYRQADCLF
eukprot:196713-Amphidinium_carterae.1